MRASDVYRIEYENLPLKNRALRLIEPAVLAAMGATTSPVWLKRAVVVRIDTGEVVGTVTNPDGAMRDLTFELENDLAQLDVEAFEAEWSIGTSPDESSVG